VRLTVRDRGARTGELPQGGDSTPSVVSAPGPTLPEYLTADQVGELLQLSAKSVYRLAASDPTFPMLKLGAGRNATVRFPRERLLRWLEQRTQGVRPLRRPVLSLAKPAHDKEPGDA
jgi:predicted DNA-binding transcriptional regulator AlpA